ncbi:MAG TPA: hypothetical protein VMU76_11400 [Acidimicrobiales bacterium]|nr:hypothetical protein [Acidimicrobiales bacterium]
MTQPSFVPIAEGDQVRPALRLRVPGHWLPSRPADLRPPGQPTGRGFGKPGPDQGFALRLARRLEDRLRLSAGESAEDVIVGCALLASRRAGSAGRAPSVHDVKAALALFGFLADAPADLVAERTARFRSVAHEYTAQRRLVDSVPEDALRLSSGPAASSITERRDLVGTADPGDPAAPAE